MKFLSEILILFLFIGGCNMSGKDENKMIKSTKRDSIIINNNFNLSDSSKLEFYTTKDKFIFFENK
ncbi:MAG: hypothetical protein JEY96_18540 [Bacteroidales bacterium]|jgi:hypothetical protein|nr:hypothetical protein [Bacteroidales bacterium]